MRCSCRTSSLHSFVQSLTGFRLGAPALGLHRARLGLHRDLASTLISGTFTRPLTSHTALLSSRQPHSHASLDSSTQDGQSTSSAHHSEPAAAEPPAAHIDKAKQSGAVLDFSPESIDSILSSLDGSDGKSAASRPRPRSRPRDAGDAPEPSAPKHRFHIRKILPSTHKGVSEKDRPTDKKLNQLPPPKKEGWQIQKQALAEKFPEGWSPRKRLSPDALAGIRALHNQFPEEYTTEVLANKFEVSAEAIRRILKSKWTPDAEEEEDRQRRWFNRGKQIWSHMAELGKKPPRKWRREGVVRAPHWNEKRAPQTGWPYSPHRDPKARKEGGAQTRASGRFI